MTPPKKIDSQNQQQENLVDSPKISKKVLKKFGAGLSENQLKLIAAKYKKEMGISGTDKRIQTKDITNKTENGKGLTTKAETVLTTFKELNVMLQDKSVIDSILHYQNKIPFTDIQKFHKELKTSYKENQSLQAHEIDAAKEAVVQITIDKQNNTTTDEDTKNQENNSNTLTDKYNELKEEKKKSERGAEQAFENVEQVASNEKLNALSEIPSDIKLTLQTTIRTELQNSILIGLNEHLDESGAGNKLSKEERQNIANDIYSVVDETMITNISLGIINNTLATISELTNKISKNENIKNQAEDFITTKLEGVKTIEGLITATEKFGSENGININELKTQRETGMTNFKNSINSLTKLYSNQQVNKEDVVIKDYTKYGINIDRKIGAQIEGSKKALQDLFKNSSFTYSFIQNCFDSKQIINNASIIKNTVKGLSDSEFSPNGKDLPPLKKLSSIKQSSEMNTVTKGTFDKGMDKIKDIINDEAVGKTLEQVKGKLVENNIEGLINTITDDNNLVGKALKLFNIDNSEVEEFFIRLLDPSRDGFPRNLIKGIANGILKNKGVSLDDFYESLTSKEFKNKIEKNLENYEKNLEKVDKDNSSNQVTISSNIKDTEYSYTPLITKKTENKDTQEETASPDIEKTEEPNNKEHSLLLNEIRPSIIKDSWNNKENCFPLGFLKKYASDKDIATKGKSKKEITAEIKTLLDKTNKNNQNKNQNGVETITENNLTDNMDLRTEFCSRTVNNHLTKRINNENNPSVSGKELVSEIFTQLHIGKSQTTIEEKIYNEDEEINNLDITSVNESETGQRLIDMSDTELFPEKGNNKIFYTENGQKKPYDPTVGIPSTMKPPFELTVTHSTFQFKGLKSKTIKEENTVFAMGEERYKSIKKEQDEKTKADAKTSKKKQQDDANKTKNQN